VTLPDSSRLGRLMAWLVLIIALLSTFLLSWHGLIDRDVWLHARAGHDILSTGRVPTVNTYSFTAPEHPWLDHEWLFQVVIAVTGPDQDGVGPGPDGVRGWNLLRTALALILALTMMLGDAGTEALRRGRTAGHSAVIGASVLLGMALLWTRLILRPELVSAILLVAVLRGIEGTLAGGIPRRMAWGDPRHPAGRTNWLVLLWAQIHGFAAFAVLLWLLAAVALLVAPSLHTKAVSGSTGERRWRTALLGAGFALLALAATPNGLAGVVYPLRALGQFGPDQPQLGGLVAELVPTLATPNALYTTILLFKLSLAWSLVWIISQWGRLPLLRVLVLVVAAGAALAGQRGLGPYAVVFVLLHTHPAGGPRWPWSHMLPRHAGRGLAILLLAGVTVTTGIWFKQVVNDSFYLAEGVARRWGEGLAPAHAPVASARVVGELGSVRVVANLDAAGCLLAHGPALLFIDGRTEAYPPELWRDYRELRTGGAAALAQLDRLQPDAVCLTLSGSGYALAEQLQHHTGWRILYAGPAALVFAPADRAFDSADPALTAREVLAAATAPGMTSARAADLTLAAAALFRLADQPQKATAALATGASLRPDHATVRHNLGNSLLAKGEIALAKSHFDAALAVNPRLAGSALNAGVCAARMGRTDDALEYLRQAVDTDPRLFGAWANLGTLLASRGETGPAIAALEQALALRPGDRDLRRRIDELRRLRTR